MSSFQSKNEQHNSDSIKVHKSKNKIFKSRKQKQIEMLKRIDDRKKIPRDQLNQRTYLDIVKKNECFELFYQRQNITNSESEWNQFMSLLLEPLPSTFRISSFCGGQAEKLRDMIQSDFIKNLNDQTNSKEKMEGKKVMVTPISWYPNQLAWTINLTKIEIRKNAALQSLHKFLISETETGDISRQEAVSMIPPLLLDIQPGHSVLDMCAAPGSKTAQIIELLHQESNSSFIQKNSSSGGDEPVVEKFLDGLVVANDVDNRRCYMLVHQSKRLHSPCVVITNHDASTLPNFYQTCDGQKNLLKFDRVLADVPCTGDGTIRKNYDVWTKWSPANSVSIHPLQLRIAKRGLELLSKNGLMVYSTCSLSPIENEAVVATLLNMAKNELELLDASQILPTLVSSTGLESWVVMSREKEVFTSFNEVPEKLRHHFRPSLFPPQNISELNLKFCLRVLPHYQNTGGFFIALLRKKVDRMCWEANSNVEEVAQIEKSIDENEETNQKQSTKNNSRKNKFAVHREDPFFFLEPDDSDWISLKNFYRFPDYLTSNQFAHRNDKGKRRNFYYLTKLSADFIVNNHKHVKLITAGSRVFNRLNVENLQCNYRLTQEGIPSIFPYFMLNMDRYLPSSNSEINNYFNVLELDGDHFVRLLKAESIKFEEFDLKYREMINLLLHGAFVFYLKIPLSMHASKFVLPMCAWKGKNSIRAYVAKNERAHLLRLCGEEPNKENNNLNNDTKGDKRSPSSQSPITLNGGEKRTKKDIDADSQIDNELNLSD